MKDHVNKIAALLGILPEQLDELDREMSARTGRTGVLERVATENDVHVERVLSGLGANGTRTSAEVRRVLQETIVKDESQLARYLETVAGETRFDKAATLARRIAKTERGFFLKTSAGADILRKCPPKSLLAFLGLDSVEELLATHDVTEAFSALRFIETDAWMHGTFEKAYSAFSASDFEERDVDIRVLGPEWEEVAKRFVEKKHHNVSHLKEFGVIFLNPIAEDVPGKFLRDFALLLHYFHEIDFYAKLFRRRAGDQNFSEILKSLLRGDVPERTAVAAGEWLIIQRYLWKDDPQDPRLFLPRVNPESVHWFRGERDLVALGRERADLELELWADLDWVGAIFDHGRSEVVSFDLEDNAMAAASAREGTPRSFSYHQREALWTKLFLEYAGGETEMERLLVENFDKKVIQF